MIHTRWIRRANICSLLLVISVTGCGSEQSENSAGIDAALMEEMLSDEKAAAGAMPEEDTTEVSPEMEELLNDSKPVRSASAGSSSPPVAVARGERLELNLRKGDRFPLIKTVEQTLVQKSEQFPGSATTRLQLTMAISVDDVQPDAILLSVRYPRVAYSHDINGQRMEYDSGMHRGAPPVDVAPYAGMVNQGFSFKVGRDNQIRELVGYQEFLQKCVEFVPLERRQSLLMEISSRFGDDGVANFVDDTIGLLPYDTSVSKDSATKVLEGDMWTRERRLMQPAPVYMTSTYQLLKLSDRTAQISIKGNIASGETVAQEQGTKLKITGGNCFGDCTVDRATGLPLEVNLTRFVNMEVTMADGRLLTQDKQIITTIRAFPESRGPVVQAAPSDTINQSVNRGMIQPASFPASSQPSGSTNAVYPD